MAAFALEGANQVWNRVNNYISPNSGSGIAASPLASYLFRDLKRWLATQKGNPQLGFYTFESTSVDDAGGQLLATGVASVLAVYAKKQATATDVFLWAIDDVDDDSTLSTKGNIMMAMLAASEESYYFNPAGIAFGLGLVMKAYTTPLGTTDSTASDCPNGFVIVAA